MNESEAHLEEARTAAQARKSWLVKSLLVLVLAPSLLIGCLYGGKSAWHWWKDRKAAALNKVAEDFYARKNLESAVRVLRSILLDQPLNERALRLWARILDDSPHNPEDAVAVWRKLCGTPHATSKDLAALGSALVRASRYKEAKTIWGNLPAEERQQRGGLELEAALLRYEGNGKEADQILRRAYEADASNINSRLKLVALDLESPFPEIKADAAQKAWEIARSNDGPVAVSAMQTLANMPDLAVTQAMELRKRLGQMQEVTGAPRYVVLSGCLKALPLQRKEMLDEEVARHPGKLGDESMEFLHWLLKNRENGRILSMLDQKTALHSGLLFPIYAEALNSSGRWKELEDLLNATPSPPIRPATSAIMLAYCSYKLGESRANTQSHLKEALHHAHSQNSLPEMFVTGTSAEEMGFNDLALECFGELSEHRAYKLSALDHVLQIRHQQGNLTEIIETLEILLEDAPGLAPYVDLLCYHKILAGKEMEKTAAIARRTLNTGRQSSPTLHLALALAAYRAHDFATAQQEASTITAGDLPAGQRAVLAGILSACGQAGRAFQLAEKISQRLLLTEETRFLKGVL